MTIPYNDFERFAISRNEEGLIHAIKVNWRGSTQSKEYYGHIVQEILSEYCMRLYSKTSDPLIIEFIERFVKKQIEEIGEAFRKETSFKESEFSQLYPQLLLEFKKSRFGYQSELDKIKMEEEKIRAFQNSNEKLPLCIKLLKNGDTPELLAFLRNDNTKNIKETINLKDTDKNTILDHMFMLMKSVHEVVSKAQDYEERKRKTQGYQRRYKEKIEPEPSPWIFLNGFVVNLDKYQEWIKGLNGIFVELIKNDISFDKSKFEEIQRAMMIANEEIERYASPRRGYYFSASTATEELFKKELKSYKERNTPEHIKKFLELFKNIDYKINRVDLIDRLKKIDDFIKIIDSVDEKDVDKLFEKDFEGKSLLQHVCSQMNSYNVPEEALQKAQKLFEKICLKMMKQGKTEEIYLLIKEEYPSQYNEYHRERLINQVKKLESEFLYQQDLALHGPSICYEIYKGNLEPLKENLEKKQSINVKDARDNTLLHHLFKRMQTILVKLSEEGRFKERNLDQKIDEDVNKALKNLDGELSEINQAILKLLRLGADYNVLNNDKQKPSEMINFESLSYGARNIVDDLTINYRNEAKLYLENQRKNKIKKEIKESPKLIRLIRKKKFQDAMLYISSCSSEELSSRDKEGRNAYDFLVKYLLVGQGENLDDKWSASENVTVEDQQELMILLQTFVLYNSNSALHIRNILATKFNQYQDTELYQQILASLDIGQIKEQHAFSTALFAHIHNDPQLKGSHLQGHTLLKTSTYLLHILKKLSKDNGLSTDLKQKIIGRKKELAYFVKTAQSLKKIYEQTKNKHLALQQLSQQVITDYLNDPTSSISIPGGWIGDEVNTGHAMLYQLKQRENGETCLVIYNTGNGIENHKTDITPDNLKYFPAMAFNLGKTTDLNSKELEKLVTHLLTPLLESEYEKTISPEKYEKRHYTAKYVYQSVISKAQFLGAKLIDPSEFIDHSIIPQYSGTCSWTVFSKAWLDATFTQSESEELEYYLKKESLKEFISASKVRVVEKNELICQQFSTAIDNFYQLVKHLNTNENGFKLSEKKFLEDCKWLEELRQSFPLPTALTLIKGQWEPEKKAPLVLVSESMLPKYEQQKKTSDKKSLEHKVNNRESTNRVITNAQEAIEEILHLETICSELSVEQHYEDLVMEVATLAAHLDMKKLLLEIEKIEMDPEKTVQLFNKIQQIMFYYCDALKITQIPTSPTLLTSASSLLGIANVLCKKILGSTVAEGGLAELMGNSIDKLKYVENSMYGASYDPLIDENMRYLIEKLSSQESKKISQNDKNAKYPSLQQIIYSHPNIVRHIDISKQLYSARMNSGDKVVYSFLTQLNKYLNQGKIQELDSIEPQKIFPELKKSLEDDGLSIYVMKVEDVDAIKEDNIFLEKNFSEIKSGSEKVIVMVDKNNKAIAVSKTKKGIQYCSIENYDFSKIHSLKETPERFSYLHMDFDLQSRFEKEINAQVDKKIGIDFDAIFDEACPKAEVIQLIKQFEIALRLQCMANLSSCIGSSMNGFEKKEPPSELAFTDIFNMLRIELDSTREDRGYGYQPEIHYNLNISTDRIDPNKSNTAVEEWYEPFNDPLLKKALGQFFAYRGKHDNDRQTSNTILTLKPFFDALDVDTDISRVMLQARVNTTVQIVSLLDFGMSNLALFQNRGWQQLFQLTLFEPGVLIEQIKRNPGIINDLQLFIKKGLQSAAHSSPKDMSTFCYFSLLNALLSQYIYSLPNQDSIAKEMNTFLIENKSILEMQHKIFRAFEAAFNEGTTSFKKENMPDLVSMHLQNLVMVKHQIMISEKPQVKDLKQFIRSMILIKSFKHNLPFYQEEILKMMMYEMKPKLSEYYRANKNECLSFIKDIIIQNGLTSIDLSQCEMKMENFPIAIFYIDNLPQAKINLYDLKFSLMKKRVEAVPSEIQQLSPFKNYFKIAEALPLTCSMHANNQQFEFNYLNHKYRCTKPFVGQTREENHDGLIERKININNSSKWYKQLVPNSTEWKLLKPWLDKLPVTLIESGRDIWYRETNEGDFQVVLASADPQGQEFVYDTQSKKIKLIKDNKTVEQELICLIKDDGIIEEPQTLDLQHIKLEDYCHLLAKFEDPRFIECIRNVKTNQTIIKLPRYNLSFVTNDVDGKLVLSLEDNPNVHLDPSAYLTSFAQDFTHYLPFEETNDNGEKRKFSYVPKQVFFVKKQKHKGAFYQLDFDTHHEANRSKAMLALPGRIPNPEFEPWNWKFSDQERFLIYEFEGSGSPQAKTFEDHLYLAYVFLATHQPTKAFELLEMIEKKGLVPQTKQDLALLARLISQIPEKTGNKKLEKKVTSETPTSIAVKLKALHLAVKNRKIIYEVLNNNEIVTPSLGNQELAKFNDEELKEYYSPLSFQQVIYESYETYNTHSIFIPDDMKLSDRDELEILRELFAKEKRLPLGHINRRYVELEKWNLYVEKENIESIRNQIRPDVLPENLQKRLNEIDRLLNKSKVIPAIRHEVKTTDYTVPVPTIKNLQFLKQVIFPESQSYYSGSNNPNPKKRYKEHSLEVIRPSQLSLDTSGKKLLNSIFGYIDLILDPELVKKEFPEWNIENELKCLEKYVENYLLAHDANPAFILDAKPFKESKSQSSPEILACRLLYYIRKYPKEFKENLPYLLSDKKKLEYFLSELESNSPLQGKMQLQKMSTEYDLSLSPKIMATFEKTFVTEDKQFKFEPGKKPTREDISLSVKRALQRTLLDDQKLDDLTFSYLWSNLDECEEFLHSINDLRSKKLDKIELEQQKISIWNHYKAKVALKRISETTEYATLVYQIHNIPIEVDASKITPHLPSCANLLALHEEAKSSSVWSVGHLFMENAGAVIKEKNSLSESEEIEAQPILYTLTSTNKDPVEQLMSEKFEKDFVRGKKINDKIQELNQLSISTWHNANDRLKLKESLCFALDKNRENNYTADEMKQRILDKFNVPPKEEPQHTFWLAKRQNLQNKEFSFEKILHMYLIGEISDFRAYSIFTDEEINQINLEITEYLIQATQEQHYHNIIKIIDELADTSKPISVDSPKYEEKLKQLGTLLSASRVYDDYYQNRAFLIYEYIQKILIFPEQMPYLKILLNNKNGMYNNEVFQLIMGGGKSKVLMPFVAAMKANGRNLSIIEVPDALLESNAADLIKVTNEVFDVNGRVFRFSRNDDSSSTDLSRIYKMFRDAIVNKEYIVTTADSIQALELKYLELLYYPVGPQFYIIDKLNPEKIPDVAEGIILDNDNNIYFIKDGLLVLNESNEILSHQMINRQNIPLAEESVVGCVNVKPNDTTEKLFQEALVKYGIAFSNRIELERENSKQIKTLEKILDLFELQGDVLIDEIDEILKISREFNYTIGKGETLSLQYRKDIVELFSFLDTLIINIKGHNIRINDLILGATKYPKADHSLFFKSLVAHLMFETHSPIADILHSVNYTRRRKIHQFLLGELHDPEEIRQYIGTLPTEARSRLALYKEQLSTLMPAALTKKLNVEYGPSLDKDTPASKKDVAIPYHGNMCPTEGSEFGNFDLTMDLTILMQRRNGVSRHVMSEMIQHFLQESNNEMKAKNWTIEPDKTKAAKEFKNLTGISLSDINLEDTKKLEAQYLQMKFNKSVMDYCLVHHVLNNIVINSKVLRTDRINHISRFCTSQGMSGTTISYKTWHHKLQFDPQGPGFGTDGRTIHTLLKKVEDKNITISKDYDAASVFSFMEKYHKLNDLRAIIDAGTCFQGISNETVANTLAEFWKKNNATQEIKVKFILYYNQQNKLTALPVDGGKAVVLESTLLEEIQSTLKCDMEQCFTYYDHSHTVGADIKQKSYARAIVTVNENTSLRDFVQAVMRMRDLAGTQDIELIISEKLKQLYPDIKQWNILSVVNVLFDVQRNQLLDDHFTAAMKNMDNIVRQRLFSLMRTEKDRSVKNKMLHEWENHFMLNAVLDPYLKYSLSKQPQDTAKILEQYANVLLNNYEACLKKFNIDAIDMHDVRNHLYHQVNDYTMNCRTKVDYVPRENEQREVVSETKKQQQLKIQVEQKHLHETEQKFDLKKCETKDWNSNLNIELFNPSVGTHGKVNVYSLDYMCKDIAKTWSFSENILVSQNFAQTYQNQTMLLDAYRKGVLSLMVIKEGEQFKMLLLTPEETDFFAKKIENVKQPIGDTKNIWIESPAQTMIVGVKPSFSENENLRYQQMMEQVRFFNGDCNLLAENLMQTKGKQSWLTDKDMSSKMQFLNDHILPTTPHKKSQYGLLTRSITNIQKMNVKELQTAPSPMSGNRKKLTYRDISPVSSKEKVIGRYKEESDLPTSKTKRDRRSLVFLGKDKSAEKTSVSKQLQALDLHKTVSSKKKKGKTGSSGKPHSRN